MLRDMKGAISVQALGLLRCKIIFVATVMKCNVNIDVF